MIKTYSNGLVKKGNLAPLDKLAALQRIESLGVRNESTVDHYPATRDQSEEDSHAWQGMNSRHGAKTASGWVLLFDQARSRQLLVGPGYKYLSTQSNQEWFDFQKFFPEIGKTFFQR
jgi:hypothetical protein